MPAERAASAMKRSLAICTLDLTLCEVVHFARRTFHLRAGPRRRTRLMFSYCRQNVEPCRYSMRFGDPFNGPELASVLVGMTAGGTPPSPEACVRIRSQI